MQSISVELQNCYGIKSLNHVFSFLDGKPYSIYAPNGFMKWTSHGLVDSSGL